MKIKTLSFEDLEDGEPETVTVEMSMEEAAMITQIFGQLSPSTTKALGFSENNIYDCFVRGLFNAYWADGVDDVLRIQRAKKIINDLK